MMGNDSSNSLKKGGGIDNMSIFTQSLSKQQILFVNGHVIGTESKPNYGDLHNSGYSVYNVSNGRQTAISVSGGGIGNYIHADGGFTSSNTEWGNMTLFLYAHRIF